MYGEIILNKLNRLSQVETLKDVKPLTSTIYPGTHCPLFGAAMTLRMIKDVVALVIGTEECTYYTKSLSLVYNEFGGLDGRCLSVVVDKHDVTFGCKAKLEEASKEVVEEYEPSAVFLITTCVLEITGDDIDSIAQGLSAKYGIPFLTVHTDHFRCDGHASGIQNVLSACVDIMEIAEKDGSVNLLGQNSGRSELAEFLRKNDVKINVSIPSRCELSEIEKASLSTVNIVCSRIAVSLAKKMEERFGTPWISFYDRCTPDQIFEGYSGLCNYLEIRIPEELSEKRHHLEDRIASSREVLEGGSFIYGAAGVEPFVLSSFLCSLGVKPVMIQTKEIADEDAENIRNILSVCDPYVTRSANLVSLRHIYSLLEPNLYLGPAERDVLLANGIVGIGLSKATEYLGFQLSEHIIDVFESGMRRSRELRGMTV